MYRRSLSITGDFCTSVHNHVNETHWINVTKKAKRPTPKRVRRWALTFYERPDFPMDPTKIRYFLAGEEICPETKRTHWQSYIELFKASTMGQVKALVECQTVHCEPCFGGSQANIEYCSKDGKVYREEGKPASKTQGRRNDVHDLREHFRNGGTLREAVDDDQIVNAVAKFGRFTTLCKQIYSVKRTWRTELHIFWGCSRSGKSYKARTEAQEFGSVYYKPAATSTGDWWCGYDGEDSVIFEDFRGSTSLQSFLVLADESPLTVPIKGGSVQFQAKRIYITSNIGPNEYFNRTQKGYEESMIAFRERITRELYFTQRWSPETGGQHDDSNWNSSASDEPTNN